MTVDDMRTIATARYICQTRGTALTVLAAERAALADENDRAALDRAYTLILRKWTKADAALQAAGERGEV